jgi:hypothetical protein
MMGVVVSHLYGRDAGGHYLVSDNGHMSLAMVARNRPTFESGDMMGGTIEENARAAETYIS